MKKLLLFVLVLLALMAAAAFLVVTWLRAEDAVERAVRAERQVEPGFENGAGRGGPAAVAGGPVCGERESTQGSPG